MDNPACLVTPDTVSAVANFVTAIAALGALAVAVVGLSTWKKQLRGNAEWETARRLLRAAYEVKGALWWLRKLMRLEEEGPPDLDAGRGAANAAPSARIDTQWARVQQAMAELSVAQADAVVIRGKEVYRATTDLCGCSLKMAHRLRNVEGGRGHLPVDERGQDIPKETVVSIMIDADDDFDRELKAAVEKVEAFTQPILGRRR